MAKVQKASPATKQSVNTVTAPKKERGLAFYLVILLAVFSILLYSNTASHDFALDDFTVIKDNNIVSRGIEAIGEIFATPYRRGWFITTNDLYRPMSLAMFATEWQLSDHNPGASHVVNILVFMGCVVSLFWFLYKLLGEQKLHIAFIAAVLFAAHPMHTEVVANIKSRDELLCYFFCFMSLIWYTKYMDGNKMKDLLVGGLLFLCSFFSKETVITMLAIVPFIFFFYRNTDNKRAVAITVTTVVAAVIFLVVRYMVLSKYNANTTNDVSFIDNFFVDPKVGAGVKLATKIQILGKYLLMMFVPYPLVCDYSYNSIPFTSFGDWKVLLSLVAYLGMAVLAVMRFMKDRKDMIAFGIIFFLATISLFSNIVLLIGSPMAERFAFFASTGFCIVIAQAIDQFLLKSSLEPLSAIRNGKTLTVLAPVTLAFSVITFNRNADWKNNETLFRADVVKAPNDSRITYYLGTEIVTTSSKTETGAALRAKVDEAIKFLNQSIAVYPEYVDAHASLGDAYFRVANGPCPELDSAEVHGVKALALNPKYPLAINNLAGVYFIKSDYPKALKMCYDAIAINPSYVNAYSNMGLCYIKMGKVDSALAALYRGVNVQPTFSGLYDNMIIAYKMLNKPDSAAKYEALYKQYKSAGN